MFAVCFPACHNCLCRSSFLSVNLQCILRILRRASFLHMGVPDLNSPEIESFGCCFRLLLGYYYLEDLEANRRMGPECRYILLFVQCKCLLCRCLRRSSLSVLLRCKYPECMFLLLCK